jgi:hypothetical protein
LYQPRTATRYTAFIASMLTMPRRNSDSEATTFRAVAAASPGTMSLDSMKSGNDPHTSATTESTPTALA